MNVETYRLFASNGRYIRQATRVTFPDGHVVRFTEKMPSKREAIRQATAERERLAFAEIVENYR